jgi:hypothetical protein
LADERLRGYGDLARALDTGAQEYTSMRFLPLRPASISNLADLAPVKHGGGDGEADFGEAAQHRREGELPLHAGQPGAETVVDAVPEREVTRISPVDVDDLRVGLSVSIPVGGGQADDDLSHGGITGSPIFTASVA